MRRSHTSALLALLCYTVQAGAAENTSQSSQETGPSDQEKANPAASSKSDTTDQLQEIVLVTASRIQRAGFTAPTPTTVLGAEDLQKTGASNIGQLMTEIPAFLGSTTPTSTTVSSQQAGGNFVDLRGLGANRTLVLVDGHRHVPTTAGGEVDTNVIPSTLIDRVEVVTGGASAAWGSDAVAGVVNLILRKDLEGFEGEAHAGTSAHGDNDEWGGALAWGSGFADGRGHFTVAGEAVDNNGVLHQGDRDWGRNDRQLIANPAFDPNAPAGQHQFLVARDTRLGLATEGGLILSGVNAFTQFGSGGAPAPFQLGDAYSFLTQVGGDGINPGRYTALSVPLERQNGFARVSWEFSDDIQGYVEGGYAHSRAVNPNLVASFILGDTVISQDNVFLPTSLRDAMVAANEPAFAIGRYNTDFGFIEADDANTTARGVVGLDGKFGQGWTWNAYYQSGRTKYEAFLNRNLRPDLLALAADAVADPVTGNAVCRSTLTDPGNGCVPINLFGFGSPSAAAIDYVTDRQALRSTIKQQVAAASIQGEPFSSWAGPVSIATGVEYRKESVDANVDAVSAADGFLIGNPKAISGEYTVREGFFETVVPLLTDKPFARNLDFNGAVRVTDYSTSGNVTTWKAGATWDVNQQVRFRATRSRDIRAANLSELFTASQLTFTNVIDPVTTNSTLVRLLRQGNPNLTPEEADTTTVGFVLQPDALPGFSASMDYYNITINGVISTVEPQDLVTRCFEGNATLCDFVQRGSNGEIESLILSQVNLSELKTRGVDLELGYDRAFQNMLPGNLSLRLLGTYVDLYSIDGTTYQGDVGNDVTFPIPRLRWNANATYRQGAWTAYLAGRFVDGGKYSHKLDIDQPDVDSRFYVDASLTWNFGGSNDIQLYGVVKNVFDKDPPVAPSTFFLSPLATNPVLYDVIGRTFTMGARFKF
jgi:iron complex outermembrane recepter protein